MTLNRKTPLNRGTSQLKRTPLARSGPIKPKRRRNSNTTESMEIRQTYREAHPHCELARFLISCGQSWPCDLFERNELHHIVCASGRFDVVSNLIVVGAGLHRWLEENVHLGRVACLIVKARKSPSEINAEEFRRCSGMHLIGYLENHEPSVPSIRKAWWDLLARLEAGT